jgi:hypothetical protein
MRFTSIVDYTLSISLYLSALSSKCGIYYFELYECRTHVRQEVGDVGQYQVAPSRALAVINARQGYERGIGHMAHGFLDSCKPRIGVACEEKARHRHG